MSHPIARHATLALLAVALVASLVALGNATADNGGALEAAVAAAPESAAAHHRAQVERGKYLVTIGGCNDCHTPWTIQADGKPGPDMSRALSGHPESLPITDHARIVAGPWGWAAAPTNTAFSGPWGVSFAANLSPDVNTGTGTWSFEIFKNAIRNGRHWGVARPLLPPMPWFNYRHMSDEDLAAVFAYTRTLTPIRNHVPLPIPPPGTEGAGAGAEK